MVGRLSRTAKNSGRAGKRSRLAQAGFTLIELMVVISIIFILMGVAVVNYRRSVLRAREAVLHQDLMEMRKAIDNYTLDKEAAPQSLQDLVPQYLREVPTDPITTQKDWVPVFEDISLSPEQTTSGMTDVHSASSAVSPFESTAYSSW
jgi:general secretion pathway protein G